MYGRRQKTSFQHLSTVHFFISIITSDMLILSFYVMVQICKFSLPDFYFSKSWDTIFEFSTSFLKNRKFKFKNFWKLEKSVFRKIERCRYISFRHLSEKLKVQILKLLKVREVRLSKSRKLLEDDFSTYFNKFVSSSFEIFEN